MISTEWFIRRQTAKGIVDLLNGLGSQRLKSSRYAQYQKNLIQSYYFIFYTYFRYWRFILLAANEKEASNWAWRVVFCSIAMGSILIVAFALDEHLSDLYLLHQANTVLCMLWWITFFMCLIRSPGVVTDNLSEGGKYSYETALDTISKIGQIPLDADEMPIVCHTCRVRRPLRSKHCKLTKRCVYKFDHFW